MPKYTPDDIEHAKVEILRFLNAGGVYSTKQIHQGIGGSQFRVTQLALSHLSNEGWIDTWMEGMGYKHAKKGERAKYIKQTTAFTCLSCGCRMDQKTASSGCNCGNSFFKVSRILYNDPYRSTSNEDDGYKFNNPGTQGEIGESGLGSTRFRNDEAGYDEFMANNYIPKDGGPFDDKGVGGSSDGMMEGPGDDFNPLNPANKNEPIHIGPHNMSGITQNHYLMNEGDLFENIRRKRKGSK